MNPTNYYRQRPPASIPYIIKAGDTLAKIAQLFGSTSQDIITMNQGLRPKLLRIGQQICIPQKPRIYPSCSTTNYYVIQSGDTMQAIAQYFGIPYDVLLQANIGVDPENLYVDQYICIPLAPSPVSVIVDLSNRRLELYRSGSVFRNYPVGVGKPSTPTPRGIYTVVYKQVEPGDNFGTRLIGTSKANLNIYGGGGPDTVRRASTGGGIIMSNREINELFNLVPVRAVVRIS